MLVFFNYSFKEKTFERKEEKNLSFFGDLFSSTVKYYDATNNFEYTSNRMTSNRMTSNLMTSNIMALNGMTSNETI